jgi:hypothetical protein
MPAFGPVALEDQSRSSGWYGAIESDLSVSGSGLKKCSVVEVRGHRATTVGAHQVKTYASHFERHILAARLGGHTFGKLNLLSLTADHLKGLQDRLRQKNLKASSVNAAVHTSLRAMLRDARGEAMHRSE